jgi:NAD(P)-dependent dehydrogenase (short-subunit alcohol dehydrogenase family)
MLKKYTICDVLVKAIIKFRIKIKHYIHPSHYEYFNFSMNLGLQKKAISVTGGSKGFRNAIVSLLTKEKAISFIVGRIEKDVIDAVELVKNNGENTGYAIAEFTEPNQCKKTIQEANNQFGRMDGRINNAGVNDQDILEKDNRDAFVHSLKKT